jgi:hypothetical protein
MAVDIDRLGDHGRSGEFFVVIPSFPDATITFWIMFWKSLCNHYVIIDHSWYVVV